MGVVVDSSGDRRCDGPQITGAKSGDGGGAPMLEVSAGDTPPDTSSLRTIRVGVKAAAAADATAAGPPPAADFGVDAFGGAAAVVPLEVTIVPPDDDDEEAFAIDDDAELMTEVDDCCCCCGGCCCCCDGGCCCRDAVAGVDVVEEECCRGKESINIDTADDVSATKIEVSFCTLPSAARTHVLVPVEVPEEGGRGGGGNSVPICRVLPVWRPLPSHGRPSPAFCGGDGCPGCCCDRGMGDSVEPTRAAG